MKDEIDTMDMLMDLPRTVATPRDERLALPRAALFDLDGTLIDSVPDITAAVAELLAAEHLPPLSQEQVRAMVGRGLKVLVRKVYDAQTHSHIRIGTLRGILRVPVASQAATLAEKVAVHYQSTRNPRVSS